MKNIYDYVSDYGNQSFFDKKFTEVDAAILSLISYIDLTNIVYPKKQYVSLGNALNYFINYYDLKAFYKRGFFQKDLVKLCKAIKDKKRFKDILLYRYYYNITFNSQFCGLTMKLPNGVVVVSYEGTDHNLVSWEEDLALSYQFPVPSEKEAISYINKSVSLFDKEVIVVGHSKGGHMALVASMFANPVIRMKIKSVYNFDGPGLRKREFESLKYKNVSKKLYHIVPQYSIVGLLMRHGDNIKSVKSNRFDIYAHSPFTWEIKEDAFVLSPLSKVSKNLDKSIIIWLDEHDDEARERIAKDIFDYLKKSGITNVTEMMKMNNVLSLIKNSGEIDKETKELLSNFIKFNLEYCINNRKDVNEI